MFVNGGRGRLSVTTCYSRTRNPDRHVRFLLESTFTRETPHEIELRLIERKNDESFMKVS